MKFLTFIGSVFSAAVISAATFEYTLTKDANVTLVIEDVEGRRIRNLVSDQFRKSGTHVETWDGRNDFGESVEVGVYRWRGIAHGPVTAHWRGSFYSPGSTPWKQHTRPGGWNLRASGAGGWLSDHVAPWCLFTDSKHVYIGCKTAEAGDSIIQCDLNGNKKWGTLWLGLSGAHALCTDGDILHVAGEGFWMGERLGVNLFNIKDYKWVPLPQEVKSRHIQHDSALVRENSTDFSGIQGLFLTSNKIAVILSDKRRVSYFNRDNGLWSHDEPFSVLKKLLRKPSTKILHGIATDADGNLYRCDTNSSEQCVKVFAPNGRLIRRIGKRGGRVEGVYDPLAMGNPVDVAIDAVGHVWVCENSFLPKRVSVWTREGKLVREYVGTPYYGGGGSIDKAGRYAYYSGMRFALSGDLSSASLDSILFDPDRHKDIPFPVRKIRDWALPGPSTVREVGGKTFLVSDDGPCRTSTFIGEIVGDRLEPRVVYGKTTVSNGKGVNRETGVFFWQNGQKVESELYRYGSEWSMRLGPAMEITLKTKDGKSLAIFSPDKNGLYDFTRPEIVALPESFARVCSLSWLPDGKGFVINRGGCGDQGAKENLFGVVARDGGKVLWSYPNPYPSNTHNSPIPRPGELRHTLGIEGFSKAFEGGLMILNGNKGTRYLFTCDGFFVTELFGDARVCPSTQNLPEAKKGMVFSQNSLSDECFGGWFGDVKNRPCLIVGKDSLNICTLEGVQSICRLSGGDIAIKKKAPPISEIPLAARGPARTVRAAGFGLNHTWWKLAEHAFPAADPVARFALGWSENNLTLYYDVDDKTPFENGGDDSTTLFHTGDALDFRWASDVNADPKRRKPVEGDQRFVIAPFAGKIIVMHYNYVDRSFAGEAKVFASPVGRVSVRRIEEVKEAKVTLNRRVGGYSVRVDIPWKELGEKTPFVRGVRRADPGVIFGDITGTRVVRRQYLFDLGSQEVSDMPSEVSINPSSWGEFEF
ncbi:MAG: hypothetical protein J6R80_00280 [Kiritimatiellae bacterium]|nr:hypothetical protein [Kiritimatiellia bacterium]